MVEVYATCSSKGRKRRSCVSEGFQAKMSLLGQAESASVFSYLGVGVAPTLDFLSPGLWGLRGDFSPSSVSAGDPVLRLESGVSWGTSVLMRASPSEAMTAEASSQLSTSH